MVYVHLHDVVLTMESLILRCVFELYDDFHDVALTMTHDVDDDDDEDDDDDDDDDGDGDDDVLRR